MSFYSLREAFIYYEQYGSGPDLVFLHGYTCSLEDWRWTAEKLASRYRVLLFDQRCHGKSSKSSTAITQTSLMEDTHALLSGLGIKNPILIGHSMGGMIALEYGLRYPDQTRALILAEAHTHIDTTARIIGGGVFDERTPKEIAEHIQRCMDEGARFVPQCLFESLKTFDVRQEICSLKMPILFLWGDRYGDLTFEKLPLILAEFGYHDQSNLEAHYIPASHHFVMLEQPYATFQNIVSFLKKIRV